MQPKSIRILIELAQDLTLWSAGFLIDIDQDSDRIGLQSDTLVDCYMGLIDQDS